MESRHSQCVWQPLLVMGLKEHFVLPNPQKLTARCVGMANSGGLCWPVGEERKRETAVMPFHRETLVDSLPRAEKVRLVTLNPSMTTPSNQNLCCAVLYRNDIETRRLDQAPPVAVAMTAHLEPEPLALSPQQPPSYLVFCARNTLLEPVQGAGYVGNRELRKRAGIRHPPGCSIQRVPGELLAPLASPFVLRFGLCPSLRPLSLASAFVLAFQSDRVDSASAAGGSSCWPCWKFPRKFPPEDLLAW